MPPKIDSFVLNLGRQRMGLPALLFLAGHRPLAFVIGQVLYVASPVADLAGWEGCADLAAVLSHPDGPARLEMTLEHGLQQND